MDSRKGSRMSTQSITDIYRDDLSNGSIHESRHLALTVAGGIKAVSASVRPDGTGSVWFESPDNADFAKLYKKSRQEARDTIIKYIAVAIAPSVIDGRLNKVDGALANTYAKMWEFRDGSTADGLRRLAELRALRFLVRHSGGVERMATALLEAGELRGEALQAELARCFPQSKVTVVPKEEPKVAHVGPKAKVYSPTSTPKVKKDLGPCGVWDIFWFREHTLPAQSK